MLRHVCLLLDGVNSADCFIRNPQLPNDGAIAEEFDLKDISCFYYFGGREGGLIFLSFGIVGFLVVSFQFPKCSEGFVTTTTTAPLPLPCLFAEHPPTTWHLTASYRQRRHVSLVECCC